MTVLLAKRRAAVGAEPMTRTFGDARTCAADGCTTRLSRYNPARCCAIHRGWGQQQATRTSRRHSWTAGVWTAGARWPLQLGHRPAAGGWSIDASTPIPPIAGLAPVTSPVCLSGACRVDQGPVVLVAALVTSVARLEAWAGDHPSCADTARRGCRRWVRVAARADRCTRGDPDRRRLGSRSTLA